MLTKMCDRCGEVILPPDPQTQATTRLHFIVCDPRYVSPYTLDLCYDCQREVFFFAKPDGTWFNGTNYEKQEEKER